MPPAALCTSSERPRASAREALKLSPPERVFTLRRGAVLGAVKARAGAGRRRGFSAPGRFRSYLAGRIWDKRGAGGGRERGGGVILI